MASGVAGGGVPPAAINGVEASFVKDLLGAGGGFVGDFMGVAGHFNGVAVSDPGAK